MEITNAESAVRMLAQDKAMQQVLRETPGPIPDFIEEDCDASQLQLVQ